MNKIIKTLLLSSLVIGMATGCDIHAPSQKSSSSESSSEASSLISSSSSEQSSSSSNTSSKESSSAQSSSNSSSSASSEASSFMSSSSAQSSSSAASSSSEASSSSISLPAVPQYINLTLFGVKTIYKQGDALDLTNLIVNITYSDGSIKTITNYTSNPAAGTILNDAGEQTVTISYLTLSKSFTITVNKTWTADEAKIMSDHLHGVVLPYVNVENPVVTYNEQYDTVYITGGEVSSTQMTNFTNAMNDAEFSLSYNATANTYSFNKTIETEAGDRFIKGTYYRDEEGKFYLEAYDPYYYSFPSVLIQKLIKESLVSEEVLPAFSADRYQLDTQNGAVYCYTSSTTAEADYTNILETAGWDISAGYNSETKFYSAVSPKEEYMVYYHYEGSPYYSLDIYVMPINYWNDKPIKAFYNKYTDYSINIPVLNVANAGYLFKESEINEIAQENGAIELIHSFLYIYNAKKADLERYVEILKDFKWDVSGSNTMYKALYDIEGKGFVRIEVEYSAAYSAVIITFYAKLEPYPIEGWPYDEIAAILTEDVTDTLPAFEGENQGFAVLNDMWGTSVTITVEAGTENIALMSYQRTLLKNGYVQNGAIGSDPIYISKNNQIWVNPYKGGTGLVTIDFKMMENIWPKTGIANALNELFGNITEVVPAYPGAEKYALDKGTDALYILITLPSGTTAETAVTEYVTILGNNGFTENGVDADGDMHYLSKKGQLDICPYTDLRNRMALYITSLGGANAWPETEINNWLSTRNFTDTLPEYTGEYASITVDTEDEFSVVITLDSPTEDDIEEAMDLYCYTLYQNRFEHTDTLPFGLGEEYTSPSNQFTVVVSPNDDGFELILDSTPADPVGSDVFPMADILTVFPQASGVMPTLDSAVSYEFEGTPGEGWCGITVTYADEQSTIDAYDAYIQALKDASFVETSVWNGYYTVYFSPDGSFAILVTDYSSDNYVYIDVYDPEVAQF